MGRVKNIAIKSLGNRLIEQYSDRFSREFENNKAVLSEVKPIKSKRIRNILAGYISNKMQQKTRK